MARQGSTSPKGASLDGATNASLMLTNLQFSQAGNYSVVITNAGYQAHGPREVTADGFERTFGVNHLGHFVLTSALMPLLLSTDRSRVVFCA